MVLLGCLISSTRAFSVGRGCYTCCSYTSRCWSTRTSATTAVAKPPTTLFHLRTRRRRPWVLQGGLVQEQEDNKNTNNHDTYNQSAEYRSQKRHLKREDRIALLQDRAKHCGSTTGSSRTSSSLLSQSEQKELQGLLSTNFVEQYSSENFSNDHRAFKDGHNQVFLKLCLYCQRANDDNANEKDTKINVFYLDGPCARTTQTLLSTLDASQCYTANRHASTCEALMMHGTTSASMTPTMRTTKQGVPPKIHIAHASAADALRTTFQNVTFQAYYLDGCGGYTPQIMDMIQASIFHNRNDVHDHHPSTFLLSTPIAIGFSILGGGRDCMDKEQDIIQSLVKLVKPLGCRVNRVGDDPLFYGVEEERLLQKTESMTMTTWCMIETAQ